MESAETCAADYKTSLCDLNCNSKLHINVLTLLAEESIVYSSSIAETIINHAEEAEPELALPVLYLIDSIIKNVGRDYLPIFSQHIVSIFTSVFQKVDERTRSQMYKLRLTWQTVFPNKTLYELDVATKKLDPAWPVNAQLPPGSSIHINPKFLAPTVDQMFVPKISQNLITNFEASKANLFTSTPSSIIEPAYVVTSIPEIGFKSAQTAKTDSLAAMKYDAIVKSIDPRLRKFDSQLSETDKLKKVELPAVSKVEAVISKDPRIIKRTKKLESLTSVTTSNSSALLPTSSQVLMVQSPSGLSAGTTISSVVNVVKRKTSPQNIRSSIENSTKHKENKSFESKDSSDTSNSKKITGKLKNEPQVSTSSKSESSTSSKDKNDKSATQKKQKSELSLSDYDKRFSETQTFKSELIKKVKKKTSPKNDKTYQTESKKLLRQHSAESLSHSKYTRQHSQSSSSPEDKRHFRRHSRSPLKLEEKKHSRHRSRSPIQSEDKKRTRQHSPIPVEEKKHTHHHSRSPSHKNDKKSPKSHSNHDVHSRSKSVDRVKRKLSANIKTENEEADEDLRCLMPSEDEDRKTKGTKHEDSDNENEPPEKKIKEEKDQVKVEDELFGSEDQDYRQLANSEEKNSYEGWAMYKKAHPDEFKTPPRTLRESIDNNSESSFEDFGSGKRDLKSPKDLLNSNHSEYDRLGRLRLHVVRQLSDSFWGSSGRDSNYPFGQSNPAIERFNILSRENPKEILRRVEEQYRNGLMSKDDFDEIQRHFEQLRFREYGYRPPLQQYGNVPYPRPIKREFNDGPETLSHEFKHRLIPDQKIQGPSRVPLRDECEFELDQKLRTIQFVNNKAYVLMDDGHYRQLLFQGKPTSVYIEGLKPIELRFDGKPVEFELDGAIHSMHFGAPSRELYINNYPYKAKFGGPPFLAMLRQGRIYQITLGGPPPIVQVSDQPVDLRDEQRMLLNKNIKVSTDVDMRLPPGSSPIGTDWRLVDTPPNSQEEKRPDSHSFHPGQYNFKSSPHSGYEEENFHNRTNQQFPKDLQKPLEWDPDYRLYPPDDSSRQGWRTRRLDGIREVKMSNSPQHTPPRDDWESGGPFRPPFNPEHFNRPPMPRSFGPGGPRPPRVPIPEMFRDLPCKDNIYSVRQNVPIFRNILRPPFNIRHPRPPFNDELNINGSRLLPPPRHPLFPWRHRPENKPHPGLLPPPPRPPPQLRIQVERPQLPCPRTSTVPNPMLPPVQATSGPLLPIPTTASDEITLLRPSGEVIGEVMPDHSIDEVIPLQSPPPQTLDINSLFEKLLTAGIISKPAVEESEELKIVTVKKEEKDIEKEDKEISEEEIPHLELTLDCLKKKYSGVLSALYRGSQCASCGMRFKEIHGERYSRHLDWHFRMNRRERDGIKKAFSRKWYYEIEDWIQFEEFEDFEERARSFFELQADQMYQTEPVIEVPSVSTSRPETEMCAVCGEPFQLFWVEEEEEWHLRNAVRHEELAYHPSCYEDFIKASNEPEIKEESSTESLLKEEEIKKESLTEEEIKKESLAEEERKKESLAEEERKKESLAEEERLKMQNDIQEIVGLLMYVTVTEEILKEEEEERKAKQQLLESQPGEEEVIGLISEFDMETEVTQPKEESEKVVFESGGIVMKVKAESLKPASPASSNLDSSVKVKEEDEEETFRPPTPDPRFQVMETYNDPNKELSGLCVIM